MAVCSTHDSERVLPPMPWPGIPAVLVDAKLDYRSMFVYHYRYIKPNLTKRNETAVVDYHNIIL